MASSQKANAKFGKYFDEECGLHPTCKFYYEAHFLNPKTALKFQVRPEFNAIPGFSEIPIPIFLGTDCFAAIISAVLETSLLSKFFV